MKLRANFRYVTDELPHDVQVKLLWGIINWANRGFLESYLRQFNIPNRTRIYKSFGWSYNYNQQEDPQERRTARQLEYVDDILQNSQLVDWVENYCYEYRLGSFLNLAQQCEINLNGKHIAIEAIRDE